MVQSLLCNTWRNVPATLGGVREETGSMTVVVAALYWTSVKIYPWSCGIIPHLQQVVWCHLHWDTLCWVPTQCFLTCWNQLNSVTTDYTCSWYTSSKLAKKKSPNKHITFPAWIIKLWTPFTRALFLYRSNWLLNHWVTLDKGHEFF